MKKLLFSNVSVNKGLIQHVVQSCYNYNLTFRKLDIHTVNMRPISACYTSGRGINRVGQPPAREPDPAYECLASGPPPYSAITLQSGPRNPSQTKAGFMSEISLRRVNALTANILAGLANSDAHYGDS